MNKLKFFSARYWKARFFGKQEQVTPPLPNQNMGGVLRDWRKDERRKRELELLQRNNEALVLLLI
jgi:hypothetical protein